MDHGVEGPFLTYLGTWDSRRLNGASPPWKRGEDNQTCRCNLLNKHALVWIRPKKTDPVCVWNRCFNSDQCQLVSLDSLGKHPPVEDLWAFWAGRRIKHALLHSGSLFWLLDEGHSKGWYEDGKEKTCCEEAEPNLLFALFFFLSVI